jgi:AcrR family transcriptional regulator
VARISVDQRRSLLVEAAFRVIARGGVEAATTRAICSEAGMALASFHYAYSSRDGLLAAVVSRGLFDELVAVTTPLANADENAPPAPTDIAELLRAGLLGYLRSLIDDPGREQAMLTLSQYAQRTAGLESFAARMYERYYELAELSLTTAAGHCGVTWETPPSELAPLVVSATDGLTLAFLATGDRRNAERIIDATVSMLCDHLTSVLGH